MEVTQEQVLKTILNIIDPIAAELDPTIEVNEDLVIIGDASPFDSMAFLDLMSGIEEWMDDTFFLYISLADDDEDFHPDGPFGTVQRLAAYVTDIVNRETALQSS